MPGTRILSIFTTLLGNKATTNRLVDVLGRLPGVEPTFVLLGEEDYRRYPTPWWARLTNPWEAEFIARKKVGQIIARQRFDILFVNTWEYVVAFQHISRGVPAAALMDSVPATANQQLIARGQGGWKRKLIHPVHHRRFYNAVPTFDRFLPMGSDCQDALIQEYRVPPGHCEITLSPQDVNTPVRMPSGGALPLKLVFVGNDFYRKGGQFLLNLYRSALAEFCELTIVSNDTVLRQENLPDGARWLSGQKRDDVLAILRQSDLFVFPTRQDYMPQVLAEALMAGVPCMASNVGSVRDLVNDQTGFLMPFNASTEDWIKVIQSLRDHPERLEQLSLQARAFAEQHLNLTRFENLIRETISALEDLRTQKAFA